MSINYCYMSTSLPSSSLSLSVYPFIICTCTVCCPLSVTGHIIIIVLSIDSHFPPPFLSLFLSNLVQEETSKLSLEEDSRAGSPDLASSRKRSGGKSKEDLQQRRPSLKSRPTKASTPSPQFEDNLTMRYTYNVSHYYTHYYFVIFSDDAIEHHRNIVR